MLKDYDIRSILINKINKQNLSHNFRIIQELSVCDGEARVDLAVANGRLIGYEIKSDADSLDRLENQIHCYNKTFDRIIIVVGEKFKNEISMHVPDHWGIYVINEKPNSLHSFSIVRPAKANPNIDKGSLLSLLWRDEIYTILKSKNISGLSKLNIRNLRSIAASNLSKSEIRNYTRDVLKFRTEWRTNGTHK